MPGRVLLYTTIVIALFSGEGAVSHRFQQAEISVPSIVPAEIYYGTRAHAVAPEPTFHNPCRVRLAEPL